MEVGRFNCTDPVVPALKCGSWVGGAACTAGEGGGCRAGGGLGC